MDRVEHSVLRYASGNGLVRSGLLLAFAGYSTGPWWTCTAEGKPVSWPELTEREPAGRSV